MNISLQKVATDMGHGNTRISVNEIFYPNMLSNMNKVTKENFIKDQCTILVSNGVHFKVKTVQIPRGFYDTEMLCNVLNKQVRQFSMQFLLGKSKMVLLTYMFFEYWFLLTKILVMDGGVINEFRKSGQSIYADYPLWDIEIKLHLSAGLAFVLGFDKEVVMKQMSTMMKTIQYSVINGQYIVDKSAGPNFMFINCNKIDDVRVRT